jgi:hypothetical protein
VNKLKAETSNLLIQNKDKQTELTVKVLLEKKRQEKLTQSLIEAKTEQFERRQKISEMQNNINIIITRTEDLETSANTVKLQLQTLGLTDNVYTQSLLCEIENDLLKTTKELQDCKNTALCIDHKLLLSNLNDCNTKIGTTLVQVDIDNCKDQLSAAESKIVYCNQALQLAHDDYIDRAVGFALSKDNLSQAMIQLVEKVPLMFSTDIIYVTKITKEYDIKRKYAETNNQPEPAPPIFLHQSDLGEVYTPVRNSYSEENTRIIKSQPKIFDVRSDVPIGFIYALLLKSDKDDYTRALRVRFFRAQSVQRLFYPVPKFNRVITANASAVVPSIDRQQVEPYIAIRSENSIVSAILYHNQTANLASNENLMVNVGKNKNIYVPVPATFYSVTDNRFKYNFLDVRYNLLLNLARRNNHIMLWGLDSMEESTLCVLYALLLYSAENLTTYEVIIGAKTPNFTTEVWKNIESIITITKTK